MAGSLLGSIGSHTQIPRPQLYDTRKEKGYDTTEDDEEDDDEEEEEEGEEYMEVSTPIKKIEGKGEALMRKMRRLQVCPFYRCLMEVRVAAPLGVKKGL